MAFFEGDGNRIFYRDTGGDAPVLLFSHGILMDHSMFDPQIFSLSGEFRCIAWDERGHGATESTGPVTYWDMADDAIALLDHLAIERATFVGMSQGGFISQRAALRHPERVAALVFIDSQAGRENPNVLPYYESLAAEWMNRGPSLDIATPVAEIILGPAEKEPWIAKWMERPPEYLAAPFSCLVEREDLTDRLPEITAPALVIHGEQDAAISVELARALCEGLPRCEDLVVVPEAGHASNLSHPEEVNAAILEFCRRHSV